MGCKANSKHHVNSMTTRSIYLSCFNAICHLLKKLGSQWSIISQDSTVLSSIDIASRYLYILASTMLEKANILLMHISRIIKDVVLKGSSSDCCTPTNLRTKVFPKSKFCSWILHCYLMLAKYFCFLTIFNHEIVSSAWVWF